ncbi:MAG: Fe-S-cluster containining protein [Psychroserpens sp.]|jgi:Fe-S-cluster containining protein
MDEVLVNLPKLAKEKHAENKKFFTKLKKKPPKDLDYVMQELHEEEFQRTDCLTCANCCKTTGPLFTTADVERVAKHLRLKPQKFIDTYLRIDEDKDYVLQSVPCTFLDTENYCMIYDVRPKACREFPHTDRKKFQQIGNLTLKNVAICPAAFNIVEEMKRRVKLK